MGRKKKKIVHYIIALLLKKVLVSFIPTGWLDLQGPFSYACEFYIELMIAFSAATFHRQHIAKRNEQMSL